jgi:hypothetical protein
MSTVLVVGGRWLASFVVVLTWGLTVPELASATQTFSVRNPNGGSSFQAGSDASYTTTMTFDSSAGAPQTALISLSPGVLGSLAANPSCRHGVQHTSACQVGTGTATIENVGTVGLTAYLVPAQDPAADVAGIDLVTSGPPPVGGSTTHAEIQLKQSASGAVQTVLNVNFAGAGAASNVITGSSLTTNSTLNGQPFSRMPSNCSPGPSSLTVKYANGTSETTTAAPDFTITGCSSLPYNPQLSVTAVKDAHNSGVAITTTVTQAADEAATARQALVIPFPAFGPNTNALGLQNTSTAVGSATAYSPLLPTPLVGKVYLTGSGPFTPSLTIRFPAPNAITLTGKVNLDTSTTTFTGIPDVPQTKLIVALFGGPQALEVATCVRPTATVSATFTGQNGAMITDRQPITVSGCPTAAGEPKASGGSLSGTAKGKPVLRFRLAKGKNAPKLKSFTLALPGGLSFKSTGLRHGLSVPVVKVSAKLHGGQLVINLKRAVNSLSVKLTSPLLAFRKHKHVHGRPKLHITVTDAKGTRTSLTVSV